MNRVTSLFGIRYSIIQGGMVWCSGWRLAAAVSNAGGLGLLGAGSMHPETLREHIRKCREATHHAFGVNIPLMQPTSPFLRAAGRCKYNLHSLVGHNLHYLFYLGIHQRDIHPK